MIDCGTVYASKSSKGQSVVKVNILGRITEWLPFMQEATRFKRKSKPIPKGTQVVVLANRYVIGAIFNTGCTEPEGANEHCEVTEYEDGTRITYDTNEKKLHVDAVGEVVVNCKTATVKADVDVKVNGSTISLNDGTGVVTGECICALTGKPHSDISCTVMAGK